MSVIRLLESLDIPHRTSGHEHCREGWVQIDCPFCSKGWEHWRLGINLTYLYANCWSCGPHDLGEVLTESSDLKQKDVRDSLSKIKKRAPPKQKHSRGRLILPKMITELKDPHRNYLLGRGFDPDMLVRYWRLRGIGVVPSRLAWRIFIPIYYRGDVISWTTRSIGERNPRYISAKPSQEITSHKDVIYGLDYCRGAIIVVEGPTSVWSIGPGAGATFGTSFSRAQVRLISEFKRRIICFDSEKEAQKQARRLCEMVQPFPGDTINVVLESGKDPAEAKTEEIEELRSLI